MKKYKYYNGKYLKYGYTTGSCAAAAAKAAAYMLKNQKKIDEVTIKTPKGWNLKLKVLKQEFDLNTAVCAIKKDAGDDPDVTHNILIYAKVSFNKNLNEIGIYGGKGIGKVTKKGLSIPVGESAINKVPKKMIIENIKKIFPNINFIEVEIFAPMGEEISKKTFNSKLGIIGGISIIGTTGIVEPMSEDAIKESLALELKILKNKGYEKIILTPGNYGVDFIKKNNFFSENVVKMSNYVGFMLDEIKKIGFKKILLVGHCGKFIKLVAGSFNTHSKITDGRQEIFTAYLSLIGADIEILKEVMDSVTTEEIIEIIEINNLNIVYKKLVNRITERVLERLKTKNISVGTLMFSSKKGLLDICDKGEELLEEFYE